MHINQQPLATPEQKQLQVIIEGWRRYSQSLSLVNQFQCLELLSHSEISLHHRDLPVPRATMLRTGKEWDTESGMLTEDQEHRINAIASPPEKLAPDITYRIAFPYHFSSAPKGKTLVFAVTEVGLLPDFLVAGPSLNEATAMQGVRIVTPSSFSRQGLIASGAVDDQVCVVPHGFDPATYQPLAPAQRERLRSRFGWSDHFVFLAVSAMYPHKGTHVLLKAFSVIAKRYPLVQLLLKGNDNVYASKALLREASGRLTPREQTLVHPRIWYLGSVLTARRLATLYQAADGLVSPYHAEGFNMPVIEAAACGLPVICTAGGPTDETTDVSFALRIPSRRKPSPLRHWKGEWLYPDLDALIDLMSRLIEDEPYRRQARKSAPDYVRRRYTWPTVTDTLVAEFWRSAHG